MPAPLIPSDARCLLWGFFVLCITMYSLAFKSSWNLVLVAHACNLSYSGGIHQEDRGSKPAQGNSLRDPISKILNTKKAWWSGSRCRP
jgi:hypothetical protein